MSTAAEDKAGRAGPAHVLYFYGIVPAEQVLPQAAGVTLGAVLHRGIAALVEPVSAREFAPEVLEEQMRSIEWVARLARKHELLLEAAMERGPVIPARLCTLFTDADAVKTRLSEAEEAFASTLDRLGGRREWGLKIYCDEARLSASLEARDPESLSLAASAASVSPGRQYILAKKRAARAEELVARRVDDVREETIAAIESQGIDVCLKDLLPAAALMRPEAMIANLALLAGPDELSAIEATVEAIGAELGEGAFLFELSGPWPPYSFTGTAEEPEEPEDGGRGEALAESEPA